DHPDTLAQLAPVGLSVDLSEQRKLSGGGRHIAGEGAEQRCFAGAVGAENHPMFAAADRPVEPVKDDRLTLDPQSRNLDDRCGELLATSRGRHAMTPCWRRND